MKRDLAMNDKKIRWLQIACSVAIVAFALLSAFFSAQQRQENERRVLAAVETANAALEQAEDYRRKYEDCKRKYEEASEKIKAMEEQLEEYSVTLPEPEKDAYSEIGWDYDYVVRVVGAECRGEPMSGILAVAQCIADTAERTGMTPEEVVKQKNPRQYSEPISRNVTSGMEAVNEACLRVLVNGERPFAEPIEYFYAASGYSAWHEQSLTYCFTIGGHRFFKR